VIVPVKKLASLYSKSIKEDLVRALQKAGLLMIVPNSSSTIDVTADAALLQRINKAITDLNRYGKKKSLFRHQEVTYEKFMTEDEQQTKLLANVESDAEALSRLNAQIKKDEDLYRKYAPFREIDIRLADLKRQHTRAPCRSFSGRKS
jgi:thymidylate kinase